MHKFFWYPLSLLPYGRIIDFAVICTKDGKETLNKTMFIRTTRTIEHLSMSGHVTN